MSDRIKVLPDLVSNQIAAGEVVESPATAIKELLENAVDAGSTSVTLNFRNAGKELIQIKDNGCGMSPIDARLAFDRHATSKITSLEDIYRLGTFGFRGEALAAIAAISQVELHSRTADDEVGTKTVIHGGMFQGQTPVAAPVGSQFYIRNLFYNVPVRRTFLENSTRESTSIIREFKRVALCHPEVEFKLYKDDALMYDLPVASLAQRIAGVAGNRNLTSKLLDVKVETSIVNVSGFVAHPSTARLRATDREQYLFVNGRYFESPYFNKAIIQAFEKLVPQGYQPSFFLYLDIDPSQIDVNVHPRKINIKFSDKAAVWQIINAAVRVIFCGLMPNCLHNDSCSVVRALLQVGDIISSAKISASHSCIGDISPPKLCRSMIWPISQPLCGSSCLSLVKATAIPLRCAPSPSVRMTARQSFYSFKTKRTAIAVLFLYKILYQNNNIAGDVS